MKRNSTIELQKRFIPGFTLIELLVVIAIIGILAALLLPVLSKGRRKAQQAQCQGNLRQIGMTIQMYADQYTGYLPGPLIVGVPAAYSVESDTKLTYYLAPLLGSRDPRTMKWGESLQVKIMTCPGYAMDSRASMTNADKAMCYALNWGTNTTPDAVLPWKPFGYTKPGMTPAKKLMEVLTFAPSSTTWAMQDVDKLIVNAPKWPWYPSLPEKPTHGGQVWNRLFFDWHVEGIKSPNRVNTPLSYSP